MKLTDTLNNKLIKAMQVLLRHQILVVDKVKRVSGTRVLRPLSNASGLTANPVTEDAILGRAVTGAP